MFSKQHEAPVGLARLQPQGNKSYFPAVFIKLNLAGPSVAISYLKPTIQTNIKS